CTCPRVVFRFRRTAPTAIYTLSVHDALPISFSTTVVAGIDCVRSASSNHDRLVPLTVRSAKVLPSATVCTVSPVGAVTSAQGSRSEEHTSELQSRENLVCRLLLEKKKRGMGC